MSASTPELAEALGRDERVVGDHPHLQPERAAGDLLADAAEAEHPERLLRELDPAPLRALPAALYQRRVAWGMLRASASSSPIVCSAAETMFDSGAFATTIPWRVAASTSTLSTPTPGAADHLQPRPGSISSAVSFVAERMTIAS